MLKITSKLLSESEYLAKKTNSDKFKFVDANCSNIHLTSPVSKPWDSAWHIHLHLNTGKNRTGVRYVKSLNFQLMEKIAKPKKPDYCIEKIIESANFGYSESPSFAFYVFPLKLTEDKGCKWLIYKISPLLTRG